MPLFIGILGSMFTAIFVTRLVMDYLTVKVKVEKVDIPVGYAAAFEGERVRKDDLYLEMGGGKTQCTELCKMAEMNDIEDGKVELKGPDIKDIKEGQNLPIAILVEAAGREMQSDFAPDFIRYRWWMWKNRQRI